MVPRYVVQDAENALFLCPSDDGDVTYTHWLHEAGRFDGVEEATETARWLCLAGYFVTTVTEQN